MLILTEEWVSDSDNGSPDTSPDASPHITAENISLALFDATGNDENLGAWLVQDYLVNSASSGLTRKFLASTGAARHVVVHEMSAEEIPGKSIVGASSSDWSAQVSNYLSHPTGAPSVARRVWPEPG
jgi:hypothetical protein